MSSDGVDRDVAEAEAAIERLAAASADEGLAIRDIWLLRRLRALLAKAQQDEASHRNYRDRYREMARTLGFAGAYRLGRRHALNC